MTNYILDATIIEPLSKGKPKQAIILCHGYGGDGKDISLLAINWQRFLPEAIFLCPNGPEICSVNPDGFQWFDLEKEKEEVILEKSLVAEKKLTLFSLSFNNPKGVTDPGAMFKYSLRSASLAKERFPSTNDLLSFFKSTDWFSWQENKKYSLFLFFMALLTNSRIFPSIAI